MTFDPNNHLIQLQGKDYLPVAWRLCWYRDLCPEGTIETEIMRLELDRETTEEVMVWNEQTRRKEKTVKLANGFVIFRATVTDGCGGSATATKSEKAASFPDYIEKCETGAVGRALAMLGYGTQFTGEEFDEGERLADAPVERAYSNGNEHTEALPTVKNTLDNSPALPQQLSEIDRLASALGKPEVAVKPVTYKDANVLLTQLSREYNKAPSSKDTVAMTRGELFERGEQRGLWTRMAPSAFYAMASAITSRAQSKQDWTMTPDEMAEMARQIEAEKAPATSGK